MVAVVLVLVASRRSWRAAVVYSARVPRTVSPGAGAVTVRPTWVLWLTPLVPVIVNGKVPVGVVDAVVTVTVDAPPAATLAGAKLAAAPAGSPEAESAIVPEKPATAVVVTV